MAFRKKSRCTCNPVTFIVAAIVLAIGLYVLVFGIQTQWNSGTGTAGTVILTYIVAIVLIACGKILKRDSCTKCKLHG